jgi:hypothetical protein
MNLFADLPAEPKPTDDWLARSYEHADCGHETLVSGDDYVVLECPFRPIASTMCVGCGKLVPLSSVAWCDTGENLAAYRDRLYHSVSFWRRMYLMLLGNNFEGAVSLNLDSHGKPRVSTRQVVGSCPGH